MVLIVLSNARLGLRDLEV